MCKQTSIIYFVLTSDYSLFKQLMTQPFKVLGKSSHLKPVSNMQMPTFDTCCEMYCCPRCKNQNNVKPGIFNSDLKRAFMCVRAFMSLKCYQTKGMLFPFLHKFVTTTKSYNLTSLTPFLAVSMVTA